jgi:hypothetical protein
MIIVWPAITISPAAGAPKFPPVAPYLPRFGTPSGLHAYTFFHID